MSPVENVREQRGLELGERVLRPGGLSRLGESFALPEDDVLAHSGASPFARRVLLW